MSITGYSRRNKIYQRSGWLLTAFTLVFLMSSLVCERACGEEAVEDADPDPADMQYSTGSKLLSQETLDKLPRKPNFRAYLPKTVDLSKNVPRPGQQGRLGSCVSWAVGYAARSYYISKYENRPLTLSNIPSPRYLFDAARSRPCNDGNDYEEVVDVLKKGAASLESVPYTDGCKAAPLQKSAIVNAFKVEGLSRLDKISVEELRGQLALGNPVLISFKTNNAFGRLRRHYIFGDRTRDFPVGQADSLHALTAIGYDDVRQAVFVINSWGRGWGNGGYAWISYDLIADKFWTPEALILDVPRPDPPPTPDLKPVADGRKPEPPAPEPTQKADHGEYMEAIRTEIQQLQCAKVAIRDEGVNKVFAGFVGSSADRDRVVALTKENRSFRVGRLVVAPWPACEILETLAAQMDSTDAPAIEMTGEKTVWKEGDILSFSVRAPTNFSYVYVAYLQADGTALHLVQPQGIVPSQTPPRATLVLGDGRDGRAKFEVAAPFGNEVIVAIASRSPLFDEALPRSQTNREYLSALRKALIYKPDPAMPERIVSAVVAPIVTRGGRP